MSQDELWVIPRLIPPLLELFPPMIRFELFGWLNKSPIEPDETLGLLEYLPIELIIEIILYLSPDCLHSICFFSPILSYLINSDEVQDRYIQSNLCVKKQVIDDSNGSMYCQQGYKLSEVNCFTCTLFDELWGLQRIWVDDKKCVITAYYTYNQQFNECSSCLYFCDRHVRYDGPRGSNPRRVM